jgi:hypothetical protein
MSFTTCPMQLQCLIQLRKQLKMSLTINNQPYDSYN